MPFETIFFDLDDTLYDSRCGLWDAIRDRMNLYLTERMRLSPEEGARLRRQYYETYGTTLRGLQRHHQIDADDYLSYVHDLPLSEYIHPAPSLRRILLSLPQQKFIFTNADDQHAHRVLQVLGLEDCFQGIIDVRALNFHCKPEPDAYSIALELAGQSDPKNCLYLDDSIHNLSPAHNLGMTTVLIGNNPDHSPAVDYCLGRIIDLPLILPELWKTVIS